MLTSFSKLWEAIRELTDFCWKDGDWIGTENMRKSGEFLRIMANLYEAAQNFDKYLPRVISEWKN